MKKKKLRQATLCFLKKDNLILLALKKRGFAEGKWNGVGGKVEEGESVKEAAIREIEEEVGVKVLGQDLKKVATLDFLFPHVSENKNWNQQVIVFLTDKWEGEPKESEEMRPQWFDKKDLPFDKMWSDDKEWLPLVLDNKKVEGIFYFAPDQSLEKFKLREV